MRIVTQAVLFDLDDTLFDHHGCARDALAAVQQSSRVLRRDASRRARTRPLAGCSKSCMRDVMLGPRAARGGAASSDSGGCSRCRRRASRTTTRRRTAAACIAIRYRTVRRAIRARRRCSQALAARAHGSASSRTTCSTNSGTSCDTCGLERFVDALIVSEEAGVSKPDPAIFAAALERAAVPRRRSRDGGRLVGGRYRRRAGGRHSRRSGSIRCGAKSPDGEPVAELRSLEPAAVVAALILER